MINPEGIAKNPEANSINPEDYKINHKLTINYYSEIEKSYVAHKVTPVHGCDYHAQGLNSSYLIKKIN